MKIFGYIITCKEGNFQMIQKEGNTLWFGSRVTLFANRASARNAIRRTLRFRKKYGYAWPWLDHCHIQKVEAIDLHKENL